MQAFAGIGSNVGDRVGYLRKAVAALDATDGITVIGRSPVYETDPVGPEQPEFLNAVVELKSELEPRDLLGVFKQIESELGRSATEQWGPREIDIDLLLYGWLRIDEPDLRIPHLQLVKRAFVLVPLADLAPGAEVPGNGTVEDLLTRVDRSGVRPTEFLL